MQTNHPLIYKMEIKKIQMNWIFTPQLGLEPRTP